jgi:hypothetical protein
MRQWVRRSRKPRSSLPVRSTAFAKLKKRIFPRGLCQIGSAFFVVLSRPKASKRAAVGPGYFRSTLLPV